MDFSRYLSPAGDPAGNRTTSMVAPARLRSVQELVRRLPPLPGMMFELITELGEPDAEIDRLEDHISRDPTLTTRLLKMANSAFFAPAVPVATVGHALMILGLDAARNLVLATAMRAAMGASRSSPTHQGREVFRHSLAVAIAARRLCRLRDTRDPHEPDPFVAGLLHDVGLVALAPLYANEAGVLESAGGLSPEVERSVLGIDHVLAGRMVHAHWKLPDSLLDPILGHHSDPRDLDGGSTTTIVALADAHAEATGWEPHPATNRHGALERRDAIIAHVGLEPDRVHDVLDGMEQEFASFLGSAS